MLPLILESVYVPILNAPLLFCPPLNFLPTYAQVTVAILLNSFVSAIAATEEEAEQAAYASLKSRDLLR